MAVTMASSQKVRRQKILKIFLPECSCRSEKSCCAVARANVLWSVRSEMFFVYRVLVYEGLSAPMRYNVLQICLVRIFEASRVYTDKTVYRR